MYRFPNLFGKWCRPNYNSAVATFCNAFANDLPYTVNDPSVELELLYIDDLVDEMICALLGKEHHCEFDGVETVMKEDGRYCAAPITHKVTLGEIVELLKSFVEQPRTLMIPEIPAGSFAKKLYSTYLSYLPVSKVAFPLKMNVDDRGSFTELVHTLNAGQVSINISKPGITLNAVEPGSDIPLTFGRPRTRLGIAHTSTALRSLLPRFTVILTKMNHSLCCEVKYVLPLTRMMAL